jgi:hypothetical protein
MEGDVQKDLTAGAVLPESSTPQVVTQQSVGSGDSTVSTTMSRSRALEEIQLRGIKSLLNRDLDGAIAAYNDAYSLWPTFRNVDEIRRALINAETAARSTPNGPDWQGIYKQVIQLDLRGLPTDVKQQLSQAANGTQ